MYLLAGILQLRLHLPALKNIALMLFRVGNYININTLSNSTKQHKIKHKGVKENNVQSYNKETFEQRSANKLKCYLTG